MLREAHHVVCGHDGVADGETDVADALKPAR